MNQEKWDQLTELIKNKFPQSDIYTEDLPVGRQECVEFSKSGDRYRLCRVSRPVVVGEKHFFSHRAGDTARTEKVLSDSEESHTLVIEVEDNNGEWQKASLEDLELI